jgi:hypothetical protein
MNLENEVVSLDLAKKLLILGVKQESFFFGIMQCMMEKPHLGNLIMEYLD